MTECSLTLLGFSKVEDRSCGRGVANEFCSDCWCMLEWCWNEEKFICLVLLSWLIYNGLALFGDSVMAAANSCLSGVNHFVVSKWPIIEMRPELSTTCPFSSKSTFYCCCCDISALMLEKSNSWMDLWSRSKSLALTLFEMIGTFDCCRWWSHCKASSFSNSTCFILGKSAAFKFEFSALRSTTSFS